MCFIFYLMRLGLWYAVDIELLVPILLCFLNYALAEFLCKADNSGRCYCSFCPSVLLITIRGCLTGKLPKFAFNYAFEHTLKFEFIQI